MRDQPLSDPDRAFPALVNLLLPVGLRGLVLCGLFASLWWDTPAGPSIVTAAAALFLLSQLRPLR